VRQVATLIRIALIVLIGSKTSVLICGVRKLLCGVEVLYGIAELALPFGAQ